MINFLQFLFIIGPKKLSRLSFKKVAWAEKFLTKFGRYSVFGELTKII